MKRATGTASVVTLLCLAAAPVRAATYYVDRNNPQANDTNSGVSTEFPWATIARANSSLQAGDVVYVFPGVYNEVINPASTGNAGNFISYFAAPGGAVVIRQASLLEREYIRVAGFEITHDNLTYNHAVTLYACNYCEILHNTIHHVCGQAIRNNSYYANSNHNVIRGNMIFFTGCPQTGNPLDWTGANAVVLLGSYNLVEYNDVSHVFDFFDLNGEYNVIRNNCVHDVANSDFPSGPGDGVHVDFWQPFSSPGNLTRRNIVESNFSRDIYEANSHYFQVRDESLLGISELIIRGNVGIRFGSYVAMFGAADYTRMYNNTFVDFAYNQAKPWNTVGYSFEPRGTTDDPSTNNHNFNNIYYNVCRTNGYIISVAAGGCTVEASHNAAEGSGSHPSCSVTSNINFSNYAGDNLMLSSSSACIDAGKAMTSVVSASGSGSLVEVGDAGFFSDGYGVVEGDRITIGTNEPARVVSITGNAITVDRSISWNQGDEVYWRKQDTSPDIGAYELGDQRLTRAVLTNAGNVYSVATSGDARFVIFYRDGAQVATDFEPPYAVTVSGGTVTAKAYALHAQSNPVVDAAAGGHGFFVLAPCRLLDTRVDSGAGAAAPILEAGQRRVFAVPGACGIPSGAQAISGNLTVVGAAALGDIRITGGHLASTLTSALSIPLARARANNAIIQLATDGSGTIAVANDSAGTVHFILDVNGYFL
jgi:hypothetical protein